MHVLHFFGPWTNLPEMAWKKGQDIVSYLSRPCRHFGRHAFWFCDFFLWIQNFQVPDFQISTNLAWARLGPSLGGLGLDEPGELFRLRFEFSMMELMSLALIVVSSHLTHWIPPRLDLWTALTRPNSIFILFLRILYFFGRFLYFYESFLYFLGRMYENL